MKTLYLIGGTMGVGKTTVCRELQKQLDRSVFLDGDWCWDMKPFAVTPETKGMVLDNICHLLHNFLRCTQFEHIIFCWVMHEQSIIDAILDRLPLDDCRVQAISLTCTEAELRKRLQRDIDAGLRQPDILERSPARLPLYGTLDTQKIDTTDQTPAEVAALVCGQ